MEFTQRMNRVEPSATLSIKNLAAEIEGDVIDLSVGEPDFTTPANIIEAGKEAIDAGHTGYAPATGIPDLKEAITDKFAEDGLNYDRDEIMVTPGAKQALFEIIQSLVDNDSEVVLLDPAWVSYEAMVKIAGGSLSRVDLSAYEFQLEPGLEDLAETVSDDVDLLIVNTPSNPSGMVFSETALKGVRDLVVDHDITVVSDEIYKQLTFDADQTSIGTLDGMSDRTITVNGFSKAYSMTGWRLGYFGAPEEVVSNASMLQSHSVTCAVNFVQRAGVEALKNSDDAVDEMVDTFERRRNTIVNLLNNQDIDVTVPEGAFYIMVPVDQDDQAWCERAIENAQVATVPGSAFGTPGYARFSYAHSEKRIREAIDRLDEHGLI